MVHNVQGLAFLMLDETHLPDSNSRTSETVADTRKADVDPYLPCAKAAAPFMSKVRTDSGSRFLDKRSTAGRG